MSSGASVSSILRELQGGGGEPGSSNEINIESGFALPARRSNARNKPILAIRDRIITPQGVITMNCTNPGAAEQQLRASEVGINKQRVLAPAGSVKNFDIPRGRIVLTRQNHHSKASRSTVNELGSTQVFRTLTGLDPSIPVEVVGVSKGSNESASEPVEDNGIAVAIAGTVTIIHRNDAGQSAVPGSALCVSTRPCHYKDSQGTMIPMVREKGDMEDEFEPNTYSVTSTDVHAETRRIRKVFDDKIKQQFFVRNGPAYNTMTVDSVKNYENEIEAALNVALLGMDKKMPLFAFGHMYARRALVAFLSSMIGQLQLTTIGAANQSEWFTVHALAVINAANYVKKFFSGRHNNLKDYERDIGYTSDEMTGPNTFCKFLDFDVKTFYQLDQNPIPDIGLHQQWLNEAIAQPEEGASRKQLTLYAQLPVYTSQVEQWCIHEIYDYFRTNCLGKVLNFARPGQPVDVLLGSRVI